MHIIDPVITEKSLKDAQKGKFTFKMHKSLTKDAIKRLVIDQFKVDVIAVKTTIVKGRSKRVGAKRMEKVLSAWKKAIVTLKEGQKISVFEVGEKK